MQKKPDPDTYQKAVSHARKALDATPADHPEHPYRLVNLAAPMVMLATAVGSPPHAARAQALYEQALRELPPSHPARPVVRQALQHLRQLSEL